MDLTEENTLEPAPVQLIPFSEYAKVFPPVPDATKAAPFQDTLVPVEENGDGATGVQLIPSVE